MLSGSPSLLVPTLLIASLFGGCDSPVDTRPNVLLITLDTTRVDHLSTYGYERPTSPNLDAFAAEGMTFERAYAPIATTGPSHSTIFTALYPLAHRVVKNGIRLSRESDTLAESLASQGFQTAAVISSFVLTERFGYRQGFEHFDEAFTVEGSSVKSTEWEGRTVEGGFDRRADETSRRAIDWLQTERDASRPFFLFVHYFDPHSPYDPPEGFRGRFTSGLTDPSELRTGRYDEEIAFTDHHVGELLSALDNEQLAAQTIVIVTSDHGEGLGQHGNPEHGLNIFEEAVRVPMLVRWPGKISAGERLAAPIEFVDLAPTIYELTGTKSLSPLSQGRSIASALLGQQSLPLDHPVFLHRRHYQPRVEGTVRVAGEKFGVRRGQWKLVIGLVEKTFELFDLESDPLEETNLYDQRPEVVAELRELLDEWRANTVSELEVDTTIDAADQEGLEALGYTE